VTGSQESSVHKFPSSHTIGVPGAQLPALQASPEVQALPSSQGALLFV
jgi:hypothetical protein